MHELACRLVAADPQPVIRHTARGGRVPDHAKTVDSVTET